MLTREGLAALFDSLQTRQTLSVYLDGRAADPAVRLAWRSLLNSSIGALRRRVAERGSTELRRLDRCADFVEQRLATIPGALGSPGFVVLATEDGIALAEALPVAVPNVAVWERGPWVSPYLRAQKELRPVILAVVDGRSARSYRYARGTLSPIGRFHAHIHVDQPTHMGSAPRQHFHPGTRGATASDTIDRARQHGTQRMLRDLVEHILTLAPSDEWIVVGGTPRSVTLIVALLPTSARRRAAVAECLSGVTSAAILRRAASEHARRLRQQSDQRFVESAVGLASERGRGSAGAESTKAALADSAVQMLLISSRFMSERPETVEELVRLALATGAEVEVVTGTAADRLDRAGGVAAVLRFVALSALSPFAEFAGAAAFGTSVEETTTVRSHLEGALT